MVNIEKPGGSPPPPHDRPPLGVSQLLSDFFRVPFQHINTLVLVGAIYLFVTLGITYLLFGSFTALSDPTVLQEQADSPTMVARSVLLGIVSILAFSYMFAAMISHFIADSEGARPTAAETLRRGLSRMMPVFVVTLLFGLLLGGIMMIAVLPMAAVASEGVMAILAFAAGGVAIWVFIALAPLIPVAVREGKMASAFGRSFWLSKDYRLAILGAMALLFLIMLGVALLLGVVVGGLAMTGSVGLSIAQVFNSAISVFLNACFAAFSASLYVRLVEIKEGGSGVDEIFR